MTESKQEENQTKVSLVKVLDHGDLKKRLNTLVMECVSDPLDRFNVFHNQAELYTELNHDWNHEYYLIHSKSHGTDFGFIKLTKYTTERVVKVVFYLGKIHRRKGYLTQCSQLIGNRVFGELGFNKIETGCTSLNEPAQIAYDKLMTKEGLRKQHLYYGGKYVDMYLYGITKAETPFADGGNK